MAGAVLPCCGVGSDVGLVVIWSKAVVVAVMSVAVMSECEGGGGRGGRGGRGGWARGESGVRLYLHGGMWGQGSCLGRMRESESEFE